MPDPLDTSGRTLHAFLDQVIDRAPDVSSVGEAERITRGVLSTLAKAVSKGELDQLAVGLPRELRDEFDNAGHPASIDRLGFLDRVGGYSSSVEGDVVEQQARAVLSTVAGWAPLGEVGDTIAQLPSDLRELFVRPTRTSG